MTLNCNRLINYSKTLPKNSNKLKNNENNVTYIIVICSILRVCKSGKLRSPAFAFAFVIWVTKNRVWTN